MGGDQIVRFIMKTQGRGSDVNRHHPGRDVVRNRMAVGIDTDHALPVDLPYSHIFFLSCFLPFVR